MKIRITLEVERESGPLTDADISGAGGALAATADVSDAGAGKFGPFIGDGGSRWSYVVEEVKLRGRDEESAKQIQIPAETVRSWPSPRSSTREIPEAGPGLWSMIGVNAHNEGPDIYTITVVRRESL